MSMARRAIKERLRQRRKREHRLPRQQNTKERDPIGSPRFIMNERHARTRGSWLVRRLRSFRYAWSGLIWLVRSQQNARIHLVATIGAIAVAFWLKIAPVEWCAVLIVIGMVWSAEALNSALEIFADHLAPGEHPLVGRAKDLAAGGVLVAAVAAVGVGFVVFGPKLVERLG